MSRLEILKQFKGAEFSWVLIRIINLPKLAVVLLAGLLKL